MSLENNAGSPVHLEMLVVTDPVGTSTGVFALYRSGSATAITLGAKQALWITDVVLSLYGASANPAAFLLAAVATADTTPIPGKTIMAGYLVLGGGITHHFETPFQCPAGVMPTISTDTDGNVTTCTMQARLVDLG